MWRTAPMPSVWSWASRGGGSPACGTAEREVLPHLPRRPIHEVVGDDVRSLSIPGQTGDQRLLTSSPTIRGLMNWRWLADVWNHFDSTAEHRRGNLAAS